MGKPTRRPGPPALSAADWAGLQAAALEYVAAGWVLAPLRGKAPLRPGWISLENCVASAEEAARLERDATGVAVAHAHSGTAALDIDDVDRAAAWLAARGVDLRALIDAPDAVRVESGRPGRTKLLYRLRTPLPTRQPAGAGLELRCAALSGGTVQDALPPSIHPGTGRPYRWAGGGDWRALPDLPEQLLSLWRGLLPPPGGPPDEAPVGASAAALRATLARFDPACGHDEWVRVGMALHHETGGSDEGFALWDGWSAGAPDKYPGSAALARRWASFGHHPAPVTLRALGPVAAPEEFPDEGSGDAPPGEAGARPARFLFARASEWRPSRPPAWHVKGLLPASPLVVVYGDPGAGKTFVVLDLVAAISRGAPWMGRRTRQSPVAYVCAEGAGFFERRLRAYEHHHGVRLVDLWVCADRPDFLRGGDHKDLSRALAASLPAPPGVIVVDTLARTMQGGDENSSEDVGAVISRCDYLHRATGATVVLVHHAGKDATRGARGWSGLRGAVDAELLVGRDRKLGTRWVDATKLKDATDGDLIYFSLGVVGLGEDEDGDPVTSCVVLPASDILSPGEGI